MTQTQPLNKIETPFSALLPLLLVIFLDVAGIVLVLPILTPLILNSSSGMLAPNTSLFVRDFLYGFSLAIFPLFMFFSTPILGDLSDKFGRKKILLLCLATSAIGYIVAAIGIIYSSLLTLLISRAIAGLAAGTQPIATAAIIDLSTSQTKTKNLAWVVFVSSIGVVIGPLIGGVTSEKSLSSWFSYQTPFMMATLVALANAILLFYYFEEKERTLKPHAIQLFKGLKLFASAFLESKFRILSLLYFCFGLAWSLYYQAITWLFTEKFHYSAGKLGLFVAYLGIISAIATSIIAKVILKFFPRETHAYLFFIFIMGVANIAAAICSSELAQWMWVILNAGSEVICFTVALTIFSNSADENSQGWIMGVIGSVGAITWTVGGLIAGPLGYINIHVPLWSAGILCFISCALMILYQQSHQHPAK